jgi:hypothetical protein
MFSLNRIVWMMVFLSVVGNVSSAHCGWRDLLSNCFPFLKQEPELYPAPWFEAFLDSESGNFQNEQESEKLLEATSTVVPPGKYIAVNAMCGDRLPMWEPVSHAAWHGTDIPLFVAGMIDIGRPGHRTKFSYSYEEKFGTFDLSVKSLHNYIPPSLEYIIAIEVDSRQPEKIVFARMNEYVHEVKEFLPSEFGVKSYFYNPKTEILEMRVEVGVDICSLPIYKDGVAIFRNGTSEGILQFKLESNS